MNSLGIGLRKKVKQKNNNGVEKEYKGVHLIPGFKNRWAIFLVDRLVFVHFHTFLKLKIDLSRGVRKFLTNINGSKVFEGGCLKRPTAFFVSQ